ncbi:hypothetical protein GGR53DRAFT_493134 [Hypoxylon sp. FL1150]|nr:hypothetical protein GGR53DRAFT_493134 [Hypoxylon sp. FL1150]
MEVLPPIPGNIFLHYLDHAKWKDISGGFTSYHNDSTFLDRLPKKVGRSILAEDPAVPSQPLSYGWGIHIIERPRNSTLYLIVGLIAVISTVVCLATFAPAWGISGLDTAIGIGQYVGTVLGLLDAAIYFALRAYCTSLTRGKT